MPVTKGSQQLVEEAKARITSISAEEARNRLGDPHSLFVDLRDIRELQREGTIPGAVHAPRGMLEFWVDPHSPYFKSAFGDDKQLVLYCQSSWRSALATATLLDMGLSDVCEIEGGFKAWRSAGGEIASLED